jgi:hypothetical protein
LYAAVYDRDRAFAGTCGSGTSSWVELTEDDLPTRPQDSTFPALTLPQLMLTERDRPAGEHVHYDRAVDVPAAQREVIDPDLPQFNGLRQRQHADQAQQAAAGTGAVSLSDSPAPARPPSASATSVSRAVNLLVRRS